MPLLIHYTDWVVSLECKKLRSPSNFEWLASMPSVCNYVDKSYLSNYCLDAAQRNTLVVGADDKLE